MRHLLTILALTSIAHAGHHYTDGQIIQILNTVNNGEIELGRLAAKKSSNPAVDMYADKMVSHHTYNKEKLQKIADDAGLMFESSDMNEELANGVANKKSLLSGMSAREFDRAYADSMEADHAKVLKSLDEDLIPSARNPRLREHLKQTRETVSSHLKRAKKI